MAPATLTYTVLRMREMLQSALPGIPRCESNIVPELYPRKIERHFVSDVVFELLLTNDQASPFQHAARITAHIASLFAERLHSLPEIHFHECVKTFTQSVNDIHFFINSITHQMDGFATLHSQVSMQVTALIKLHAPEGFSHMSEPSGLTENAAPFNILDLLILFEKMRPPVKDGAEAARALKAVQAVMPDVRPSVPMTSSGRELALMQEVKGFEYEYSNSKHVIGGPYAFDACCFSTALDSIPELKKMYLALHCRAFFIRHAVHSLCAIWMSSLQTMVRVQDQCELSKDVCLTQLSEEQLSFFATNGIELTEKRMQRGQ